MAKSFERKISIKIILVFLVVIAYFCGLFIYLNRMNETINEQRQEVEDLSLIVGKTNALISSIQEAQGITVEYVFSQKKDDLNRYQAIIEDIPAQIQELGAISVDHGQSEDILKEVSTLLEEKNNIVKDLSAQFNRRNPMKRLNVKIDSIQGSVKETVEVTVRKDSIVLPTQEKVVRKKGLWSRIKNVFAPTEQAPDTTVRIVDIGTTHKTTIDTLGMFQDLRTTTNQLTVDYQRKIAGIEQRVRQLIVADAAIFAQISQLLMRFHEETIQTVFARTYANEQLTRKVFRFAVNSGGVSLLLILFIIALIVGDLVKGRRARRDLIKEKQLTEQLMESRHKLLLTMSHDIKTPLSSMIGYMDLWRMEETDPAKNHQLQSALNSGGHILNMLSNLLEYSRLEKQAYRPKESVFNLSELCGGIIEMFRPIADEKNLELRYASHIEDPCFVRADHTGVKQILSNIVSNAIKYTMEGHVEFAVDSDKRKFKFRISDTGVGIDTGRGENVFRPFSRMDNPVSAEGSGFGLYVAKGLAVAMGGSINMESEVGKGTTVNIFLPLDKAAAVAEKTDEANPLPQESKKILVFEDDKSLGNVLVEIMRHMGHDITLREDCDVASIDTSLFDMVFTDMEMGKFTGNDVLREIRKVNEKIPVWLLTAHGDIADSDAKQAGFSGLIAKPVTISALNLALQTLNAEDKKQDSPRYAGDEFPALSSMLDGDQESINEILRQFVDTAQEDLLRLQRSVNESDFAQTRRVLHKILPFLQQLGSRRINLEIPRKMNTLKDDDEPLYPAWKEDACLFASSLELFAAWIKEDYLSQNS